MYIFSVKFLFNSEKDEKIISIFLKSAELFGFCVHSLERLGLEWRVSMDDSRQNIKVYFLSGAFISTGCFPFFVILTHHFMCTTHTVPLASHCDDNKNLTCVRWTKRKHLLFFLLLYFEMGKKGENIVYEQMLHLWLCSFASLCDADSAYIVLPLF